MINIAMVLRSQYKTKSEGHQFFKFVNDSSKHQASNATA